MELKIKDMTLGCHFYYGTYSRPFFKYSETKIFDIEEKVLIKFDLENAVGLKMDGKIACKMTYALKINNKWCPVQFAKALARFYRR